MTEYGYYASHEQFPPEELVELAMLAEECGFDAVHSTNHFGAHGGEAGFAWSWLGATMCRTRVPFEVVTTPGWRFHPAQVAHSISTTCRIFPGRLVPALASDETADQPVQSWPGHAERSARLAESATVIRALLSGRAESDEPFTSTAPVPGWTLPEVPPPLFGAATTPTAAAELASWADGLITVGTRPDEVVPVASAFRARAGPDKPVHLQVDVAWRPSLEEAQEEALLHWSAKPVRPGRVAGDDFSEVAIVTDDAHELSTRLEELAALGIDRILLHPVGTDQAGFLRSFDKEVRPLL
ncbi:LLM class F420-dependent oxidoreductase [Nocardioides gansuensis]|uniref:LLM class F420-dependent oxidoreductase n=1 Tax=Nocardioides gansuensis TaxID=2138300 RepID=A0A2T8F9I4_9ACTN|nr:LLM class flavin-dependent oxidoreductase [Nocardioides gansuensis]PVG82350.1 LLM class F420-dependent oxidoreductase [Nocardioides gansuensis]